MIQVKSKHYRGIEMSRFFAIIATLLLGTLPLTACSSDAGPSEPGEYIAPAWMAQQRLEFEEAQESYRNCLEANGIKAVISHNGYVGPDLAEPGLSEAANEVRNNAIVLCEESRQQTSLDRDTAEQEYFRMLETRECLVSKGYPIPEPPTQSIWVELFQSEETNGSAFRPYYELAKLQEAEEIEISDEELGSLQKECVATRGGGMIVDFEYSAPAQVDE